MTEDGNGGAKIADICYVSLTHNASTHDALQSDAANVVSDSSPLPISGGAISQGEGGRSPETDDELARAASADAGHLGAKSSEPAALPAPDGARAGRKAHIWERDPHDYYVEGQWCNAALFAAVPFCGAVYDPACGMGRIVTAARAAGIEAWGTDLIRRWNQCFETANFLDSHHEPRSVDNIVCNPPFRLCQAKTIVRGPEPFAFVKRCLEVARYKVALLLPAGWHHSLAAADFLTGTEMGLAKILVLTPRPSMPPGRLIEAGVRPGGGTIDFAYFVFVRGHDGPPHGGWLRCPPEFRKSRSAKLKGGQHG